MDMFYVVIGAGAAILLIVLLICVGLTLQSSVNGNIASNSATCPDNWGIVQKPDSSGGLSGIITPFAYGCQMPSSVQGSGSKISTYTNPAPAGVAVNLNYNSMAHTVDFTDPVWTGTKGLCLKQNWANSNSISWDGVTNIRSQC